MTKPFEPVPASQLFRVLLIHLLETQAIITPMARTTTSRELKRCQMQNAYTLSEIESWLQEQAEDLDLTPSLSAVHVAELRAGLESSSAILRAGGPTPVSAPTVPQVPRRGSRRAASSRRSELTRVASEATIRGVITFRQLSSSEKPSSTLPTPPSDSQTIDPVE